MLVGRDEGTLSNVRKGLAIVNGEGGSEGSEHVVRVGDVGDGQFWRGLRGEVSLDSGMGIWKGVLKLRKRFSDSFFRNQLISW